MTQPRSRWGAGGDSVDKLIDSDDDSAFFSASGTMKGSVTNYLGSPLANSTPFKHGSYRPATIQEQRSAVKRYIENARMRIVDQLKCNQVENAERAYQAVIEEHGDLLKSKTSNCDSLFSVASAISSALAMSEINCNKHSEKPSAPQVVYLRGEHADGFLPELIRELAPKIEPKVEPNVQQKENWVKNAIQHGAALKKEELCKKWKKKVKRKYQDERSTVDKILKEEKKFCKTNREKLEWEFLHETAMNDLEIRRSNNLNMISRVRSGEIELYRLEGGDINTDDAQKNEIFVNLEQDRDNKCFTLVLPTNSKHYHCSSDSDSDNSSVVSRVAVQIHNENTHTLFENKQSPLNEPVESEGEVKYSLVDNNSNQQSFPQPYKVLGGNKEDANVIENTKEAQKSEKTIEIANAEFHICKDQKSDDRYEENLHAQLKENQCEEADVDSGDILFETLTDKVLASNMNDRRMTKGDALEIVGLISKARTSYNFLVRECLKLRAECIKMAASENKHNFSREERITHLGTQCLQNPTVNRIAVENKEIRSSTLKAIGDDDNSISRDEDWKKVQSRKKKSYASTVTVGLKTSKTHSLSPAAAITQNLNHKKEQQKPSSYMVPANTVVFRPPIGVTNMTGEDIKKILLRDVKPGLPNLAVKGLRVKLKEPAVAVECADQTNRELLKQSTQVKATGLEVSDLTPIGETIQLVGTDNDIDLVMDDLWTKNLERWGYKRIEYKDSVIPRFKLPCPWIPGNYCRWIIEVPTKLKEDLLSRGMVLINWKSVSVKNHTWITRCFRCQEFGHMQSKCTASQPTCGHCGISGHSYSACTSKAKSPSCGLCLKRKKSSDHHVRDMHCPEYIKEVAKERSKQLSARHDC